jgi:hypothetical protein
VLRGNADGTFQAARNFTVGLHPDSLAVVYLTYFFLPDIITANAGDNTVSVLLGNGDGTFQPARSFPVGSHPDSVAYLPDFYLPAIITANKGDNTVTVLPFDPLDKGLIIERPIHPIIPRFFPPSLIASGSQPVPILPQPSVSQLPIAAPFLLSTTPFVSTTTIFSLNGGRQVPVEVSVRAEQPSFDPLPARLDSQLERLNLPTESDIFAGMNVAGSLLRGNRAQANLVPQPQDTKVAVGVWSSVDDDGGALRKSAASKVGAEEKIDVRLYLRSPVEDTILGPPSTPESTPLRLDLGGDLRNAVDAVSRRWEDEVERSDQDRSQPTRLPVPWGAETLPLNLILMAGQLCREDRRQQRSQPNRPAPFPDL